MNITELNKKYVNSELSSTEGDKQFRYEVLSPLFKNIYENKVVYHERVTSIIKLENIELSPDSFNATAIRLSLIENEQSHIKFSRSREIWTVGANWAYLRFVGNCISPYSGWMMWVDPELVEKVEKLVIDKNFDEALNLTIRNL
jgi:hypothetical protein